MNELAVFSKASMVKDRPKRLFPENFDFKKHVKQVSDEPGKAVFEFIGTGDFPVQWYQRQQYEVDTGRDLEPLLYTPFYEVTEDSNLPQSVTIYYAGPGGVVFDEVVEGGEAKFMTISNSSITIPIKNYAVMLEYSEDLIVYNQTWNIPIMERQTGIAYNALLNYLHFYPILNGTYGAANSTSAASGGGTLFDNMILTLEDAVSSASQDTANYRRGPYAILCSVSDQFKIERALRRVPQLGYDRSSSVIDQITTVVAYDGWVGHRGNKAVTYPGVTPGTAYLVDVNPARKMLYAKSMMKQPLGKISGNADISRFIAEQTRWNTRFGLYLNPTAIVEQITLPTNGT